MLWPFNTRPNEDQPVHVAALAGDVEWLRELISRKKRHVRAKGWFGRTPLQCAAHAGSAECVQLLLAAGASVNSRDDLHAWTPLHEATGSGSDACVRLLLEHGADVDARCRQRAQTPLFFAKTRAIVELLADWGAYLNVISAENHYPFQHCAAYIRSPEVMQFWIEQRVDINHVPTFCWPALHGALHRDIKAPREDPDRERIIELLLDAGADVNLEDKRGDLPLQLAISWHGERIIKLILQHGADVCARKRNGDTALHAAAHRNHVEIARLLLESAADPNAMNIYRQTPIHAAERHPEMLALLKPLARETPLAAPKPDSICRRLEALGCSLDSCSEDEIDALEKELNVVLPAAYKEFLRRMGHGADEFLVNDHWSIFYPSVRRLLRDRAYESHWELPESSFVFATRLGDYYLFFIADGQDDDPPIYCFGQGDSYKKSHDSIWGFLELSLSELEVHYGVHPPIPGESTDDDRSYL